MFGLAIRVEQVYDRGMTAPTATEQLETELAQVCGVLNQAHARLVSLVAAALEDESWACDGIRSPEHFLVLRAGLSRSRAAQVVAVARRRAVLPSAVQAFEDGQLSVDQMVVVGRHTPASLEASVTELAVNASVTQLQRALGRHAFDPADLRDPAGSGTLTGSRARDPLTLEERAAEPPELSMSYLDGRFLMRFSAPADLGALVEAAVLEATDQLFNDGVAGVSSGQGLVQVATRSLGALRSASRRDAFRVYVHLDTDGAWLTGHERLPQHVTDKLCCDGVLQPVWVTQGSPVNVGRAQRIVPRRTRRLAEDRDRGCRFPGCGATAHVEVHHLVPWSHGGRTDIEGLVCLCPYHHDRHHAGDFAIEGAPSRPDGLRFRNRFGALIRPGPTFARPAAAPSGATYHGPTGERLHSRWVSFHPPPVPRSAS